MTTTTERLFKSGQAASRIIEKCQACSAGTCRRHEDIRDYCAQIREVDIFALADEERLEQLDVLLFEAVRVEHFRSEFSSLSVRSGYSPKEFKRRCVLNFPRMINEDAASPAMWMEAARKVKAKAL